MNNSDNYLIIKIKKKSNVHGRYSLTDRWVGMEAKIEKEGYIYLFPHSDAMQMSLFIHMFCICFFLTLLCSAFTFLHCFVGGKNVTFTNRNSRSFPSKQGHLSSLQWSDALCWIIFSKATRIQRGWSNAERRINYFVKENSTQNI